MDNDEKKFPEITKLKQVYWNNIGKYFERLFASINMPKDMMPDFSISNRVDSYTKKDTSRDDDDFKYDIHVEEYKVKSPEGDELVFAMAYDDGGRVYIDNVYDPRVGMSDYGTMNEITQMGILVYKPEDYPFQVSGIPQKYLKTVKRKGHGDRIDMNALWRTIPVIKKYKEELIRRGIKVSP